MTDNAADSAATDTVLVAESTADATESAGQDTTPDTPETPDSGELVDNTDQEDVDDTADTFPRSVVEKLRKESAGLRDRAKTAEERAEQAEERLIAVQRQLVGHHVAAAGMKPAAVAAVAPLDDVLADDGTVDAAKVQQAIERARVTLGARATPVRNPAGRGSFQSGATGTLIERLPRGFESAFRPRED